MSDNDASPGIFYIKQSGKEDCMAAKYVETKAKLTPCRKQGNMQKSQRFSF